MKFNFRKIWLIFLLCWENALSSWEIYAGFPRESADIRRELRIRASLYSLQDAFSWFSLLCPGNFFYKVRIVKNTCHFVETFWREIFFKSFLKIKLTFCHKLKCFFFFKLWIFDLTKFIVYSIELCLRNRVENI